MLRIHFKLNADKLELYDRKIIKFNILFVIQLGLK